MMSDIAFDPFDRPRIPNTPEREALERRRSIREVVFGAQDGVLTTLGLVTGVGAAHFDRPAILLAGFLSLLVGGLSMGVGEYLGGKSEREVVRFAIALEQREMIEKPEEEYQEQVHYYKTKGFTGDEARMIVDRLAKNPDIWLHEMMRDEFGIDLRIAEENSIRPALSMGASFALGAFVPIVPALTPLVGRSLQVTTLLLAAIMLFTIGAIAGRLAGRSIWRKGLEIVSFGFGVFIVAYSAGHFVPMFFGHGELISTP